ncbi:MAG: hypothetical protein LBF97_01755, partial [Elusimicrobiota bacterium]|nr:hypothetical protein [Elusimicrobiota bacterium]
MVNFVEPNLEQVFQILSNNDKLVEQLNKDNLILTKEMLSSDYSNEVLKYMEATIFNDNINTMYNLASVLLSNHDKIYDSDLHSLMDGKFLFKEIKSVYGEMDISDETYHTIFYTYKYCCISSFFQNNMKYFIPEYDLTKIQDNEIMSAFMDSVNKEFDKLDYVLSSCRQFQSPDEVKFEYINYLSQLFGFETKDMAEESLDQFKIEKKYRTIIKNIIEIYKIRGTNYAFELFFSFLGFNITIKEFYFDRRCYYKNDSYNEETENNYNNDFEFYLTTKNPTLNSLSNVNVSEICRFEDMTEQYSLLEFEELIKTYGPECVIGYSPVDKYGVQYTGKIYKFFKTNYIYYNVGITNQNLTSRDIKVVQKYLEFLTPAFVMKVLNVDIYDETS